MNYQQYINAIKTVIDSSFLPTETRNSLDTQLDRIKKRTIDNNLYVGIVGEFSSGKSTLINSLIGADFFVTNAMQGTTTVTTKLSYGKKVNLTLNYVGGTKLTYSKDKRRFLKKYLPGEYEKLPLLKRMSIRIKDILNMNGKDEYLMKIFDTVTTSNEISETLEDVQMTYPAEILRNGIVIVDTPGTDSLNPKHTLITQKAIREVCDIAIIVVPATHPLTITMVDFLDENLQESKDKCIYFITKIELLRKEIERTHISNNIVQRIQTMLKIESPNTIMAPTLLSLEEKGITEKSGIIRLTDEERVAMVSQFDSDLKRIIKEIADNKESTIKHKIALFIDRLQKQLKKSISDIQKELEKELEETRFMRVEPLRDFMAKFYESNPVIERSYIETVVCNNILSKKNNFKSRVFSEIDSCQTKDDAQSTMSKQSVIDLGVSSFDSCYRTFNRMLNETQTSFKENFDNFRASFTKMFSIDAIDFQYSIKNNPDWQRAYNFCYDTSDLTTFPLFRFFKSLDSVKQEMKDDVGPKISGHFNSMESHYLERIRESYSDIEQQMENVKKTFIEKYEYIIAQRIKKSDEKERQLNAKLNILQQNIKLVKDMSIN